MMRKRSAFTLVEMLIVISIVALLVALLLPSLGRGREAARRVRCASGARQVNVSIDLYATDSADYYIYGKVLADSWPEKLRKRGYASPNVFTREGGCPYGPKDYFDYAGNDYYTGWSASSWPLAANSYGFNFYLQSAWDQLALSTFQAPLKRSGYRTSKFPTKVTTVACNVTAWSIEWRTYVVYASLYTTLGDPQWYPATQMVADTVPRHNAEGLPFTFADGHSQFMPASIIKTGPVWGPGWHDPLTIMDYSFAAVGPAGFPP